MARGAYLVRVGNCMPCHTDRGGAPFAGGRAIETPFGTVYASNLTPAPGDRHRQLVGRRISGAPCTTAARATAACCTRPSPTPTTRWSRAPTADAMFDYLRSLPPVDRPNTPHRLRWPYSTQAALAVWRALYFTARAVRGRHARQSPEWNRGAYLVRGLGHCGACHTRAQCAGRAAAT